MGHFVWPFLCKLPGRPALRGRQHPALFFAFPMKSFSLRSRRPLSKFDLLIRSLLCRPSSPPKAAGMSGSYTGSPACKAGVSRWRIRMRPSSICRTATSPTSRNPWETASAFLACTMATEATRLRCLAVRTYTRFLPSKPPLRAGTLSRP